MECKTFEIRDRHTFIPALAVRLNPTCEEDRYLLARAGFGQTPDVQGEYVCLWHMDGGNGLMTCDEYDWKNRTMQVAHAHAKKNWDSLRSGDVIDVEFILGETSTAKQSESRLTLNDVL